MFITWYIVAILFSVTVVRGVWVIIYRLFFHPLAKVPGPLLARAFFFYSFWYNAHGGRLYLQIEKLHQRYGPTVRISPDEIHLSDPEDLDKIYYFGSRFGKSPAFYRAFGLDNSLLTIPDNDLHRVRRAALNPFFSRKMVFELEDVVQAKAQKLTSRMRSALESTGYIDLHYGFRAVSLDVLTDYAFDDCYGCLDKENFGFEIFKMIRDIGPTLWFFQEFPFMRDLAIQTPFWLAKLTSKSLSRMMLYRERCKHQILEVKEAVEKGDKVSRKTVFHQLLRPDDTEGYKMPSVEQLSDDAYVLIAAAADTTGNAMTMAAYNVVTNPEIYERLTAELRERFPDPEAKMDLVTLEKLPYLTAVIKEGLRLSYGVVGRIPRTVPEPGAEFHGYHVPGGTTVSMSSWMLHRNEDLFPNAEKFDPARWQDPATRNALEKHLFSFGRGPRQCVGMQLAYAELYITLGRVFRQFDDLKTRKKAREELLYDDYFSAYHPEAYNKFIFERAR
ncbi:trichodiene oxygenase [Aspergillus udagawae]|uniref:Trichodiene oxygenase n=1 Tax=Aspergillus udagawae TaxID=91492 RepID=A0A8H3NJ29_9EURO|nr:trichodiene oxygenase [Aspergillus udagawae]